MCTSLWLLARVALFVNRIWFSTMFQSSDFARKLTLLNSTAPTVILAILILLPWRRLSKSPYWTALLLMLVIAAGKYFYATFKTILHDNFFIVLIDIIIIIQVVTILKIRQASNIQDNQRGGRLYEKSVLWHKLGAIVVLAIIIGAGLDLQHLTWLHSDGTKKLEIIWFTLSVPLVVIAMILFSLLIKPRNMTGCIWLCLFSIPVSIVAMFYTYRAAIERYHLLSDTGMAVFFGIVPAMIIGFFFALWIYITCKANFAIEPEIHNAISSS